MVSEVETRALMDFVLAHRNIGAILTFGETDNLVTPPDSRGALAGAKVPEPARSSPTLPTPTSSAWACSDGGGGGRGGGGGGWWRWIYLRGAQPGRDNDPSSGTRPVHHGGHPGSGVLRGDFRRLQANHRHRERPVPPDSRGSVLRVWLLPVRRPLFQHPGMGRAGQRGRRLWTGRRGRGGQASPAGRGSGAGSSILTGPGGRGHRRLRGLESLPASGAGRGGDRWLPALRHSPTLPWNRSPSWVEKHGEFLVELAGMLPRVRIADTEGRSARRRSSSP